LGYIFLRTPQNPTLSPNRKIFKSTTMRFASSFVALAVISSRAVISVPTNINANDFDLTVIADQLAELANQFAGASIPDDVQSLDHRAVDINSLINIILGRLSGISGGPSGLSDFLNSILGNIIPAISVSSSVAPSSSSSGSLASTSSSILSSSSSPTSS